MQRRGLVIGLLVVGVLLGVLLGMSAVLWRPAATPPAHTPAAAPAGAPRFPPALGMDLPSMAAPIAVPPRTGPRELCGWGRFEPTASMTGLPAPVQQAADQALRQIATTLIAGDPRSVARGLAFRAALAYHAELAGHGDDPKSMASAYKRAAAQSSADRQALAKLALGSRDVEVYKTAYLSCLPESTVGACAQLTAAEWGRRDPADGLPWLFAAQEAHNAKDVAARDEAMYRLSQANRMSELWHSLSALADQPSLESLPTSTRIGAVLSLMALQSMQPLPAYGAVLDFCSQGSAASSSRNELCIAVAKVLMAYDSTLVGSTIGLAVGERVGWPAARLQALRDERDALSLIWTESAAPVFDDPTSCAGFEAFSGIVKEHGRLGELGLLRERIRQSGEPVSVLAQRWRARQAAEIEAAKATTSGASGTQAR